jgi:hypothetical protein
MVCRGIAINPADHKWLRNYMVGFQREIEKNRVSITLNLHTGGALKKVELPLKAKS